MKSTFYENAEVECKEVSRDHRDSISVSAPIVLLNRPVLQVVRAYRNLLLLSSVTVDI